ncbi:MAG: hypothetical protein LBB82_09910 [Treponema sp.]|jgi:hypothetical protein|nr:hypothetical protein [Treponema sp.]
MRKTVFLAGLVFWGTALFALDLTVTGGFGNFAFDPKDKHEIGGGEFDGNYAASGKIELTDTLSDLFRFTTALERDPVLRNSLGGELEIGVENFSFAIGPFFGIFNSSDYFKPGISTSLEIVFPGIIFGRIDAGATLQGVDGEGDYSTLSSEIAVGFWLPHLVNIISLATKKFSIQETGYLYTEDSLWRFQYRGEIHSKSNNYIVAIDIGYQTLRRSYEAASAASYDEVRAVFLGFDASITVKPLLTILLGLESPVYFWGKAPLERGGRSLFFQAMAGFRYRFE